MEKTANLNGTESMMQASGTGNMGSELYNAIYEKVYKVISEFSISLNEPQANGIKGNASAAKGNTYNEISEGIYNALNESKALEPLAEAIALTQENDKLRRELANANAECERWHERYLKTKANLWHMRYARYEREAMECCSRLTDTLDNINALSCELANTDAREGADFEALYSSMRGMESNIDEVVVSVKGVGKVIGEAIRG